MKPHVRRCWAGRCAACCRLSGRVSISFNPTPEPLTSDRNCIKHLLPEQLLATLAQHVLGILPRPDPAALHSSCVSSQVRKKGLKKR